MNRRDSFEHWVMNTEHPPFGWLDHHWLVRKNESYIVEYIHGCWAAWQRVPDGLFEFLEHGDDDHRAWLKEAIMAFFNDEPRPMVRP